MSDQPSVEDAWSAVNAGRLMRANTISQLVSARARVSNALANCFDFMETLGSKNIVVAGPDGKPQDNRFVKQVIAVEVRTLIDMGNALVLELNALGQEQPPCDHQSNGTEESTTSPSES